MEHLNQVHEKREEVANNILNIYSNKDSLTTKELSVEEFQKSYPVEEFTIVTNDILKSYSEKIVEDIEATKDQGEREMLVKSSAAEINSYDSVIVKAENGVKKRFYVKKKEDNVEKADIEKVESVKDSYEQSFKEGNSQEKALEIVAKKHKISIKQVEDHIGKK